MGHKNAAVPTAQETHGEMLKTLIAPGLQALYG